MAEKAVKRTRRPRVSSGKRRAKAGRTRKTARFSLKRGDRFTILWLVLFFPIGLTRMWKDSCHWRKGVKYAVTGVFAAIAAAILVVPSPYQHSKGGVEIIAEEPEVEIYGPSAPKTVVGGYTSTRQESVVVDATDTSSSVTVYAAVDGKCYHLGDCKFAYASGMRLTVYEAYYLGKKPCGNCQPPVYDPVTGQTVDNAAAVTTTDDSESALTDAEPMTEEDLNNPDDIV